jgi:hypothetical protein
VGGREEKTKYSSSAELPSDPLRKLASTYRAAVVEQFLRFAKEVEDDASLLHPEKLAALMEAVSGISDAIDRLSRSAPEHAPELWENRSDKSENAYDFTRRVYRDYLPRGLSQPDIRSLDPKLYQAILDRRRRSPDRSLSLPNRSDVVDQVLRQFAGDPSLATVANTLPEMFRGRIRAYRTAVARRRRAKSL